MRLGSIEVRLVPGTQAWRIYGGVGVVSERHRHRYQINPAYLKAFEENGFVASGFGPEGFPEVMELKDRKFYLGVQYHPEFKSRPLRPSPIFAAFINALLNSRRS